MKSKVIDLKRIKIAIAAMLIVILTASTLFPIFAEEDVEDMEDVELDVLTEPEILTLEKAIELAMENNFDVKIAGIEMEESLLNRRKLLETADIDFATGNYDTDLGIELAKVQKDYLKALAESIYDVKLIGIELEVKSTYAGLIHARNNFELAEKYLAQAQESYTFMNKRFELGQVAKTSVLEAESEVATKEAELIEAQLTFDNAMMDLNMLMNQELNKEWILKEATYTEMIEIPELSILQVHMLENHPSVMSTEMSYKIAETTYDVASGFYPENVYIHREAKQSYEKAAFQYDSAKLSQEKNLAQAYQNLDSITQGIEALEKSVELINESYRSAQLRMELGFITSHTLNEIALTQQRMEANLINMQRNYQLAVAQLEAVSGYTFLDEDTEE
jgi:outer membrane protein TolC